jgi:hypothetical protein
LQTDKLFKNYKNLKIKAYVRKMSKIIYLWLKTPKKLNHDVVLLIL